MALEQQRKTLKFKSFPGEDAPPELPLSASALSAETLCVLGSYLYDHRRYLATPPPNVNATC